MHHLMLEQAHICSIMFRNVHMFQHLRIYISEVFLALWQHFLGSFSNLYLYLIQISLKQQTQKLKKQEMGNTVY